MLIITAILSLFLAFPLSLFLILSSIWKPDRGKDKKLLTLVSAACGPVFYALLLRGVYGFLPFQSDYLYLGIVYGAFLTLTATAFSLNRQEAITNSKAYLDLTIRQPLLRLKRLDIPYILLFLGFLGLAFLSAILPVMEADPLQYTAVSQAIYSHQSSSIYPITEPLQNGYYAISSHPLSFYMLSVFGFLVNGHEGAYLIKYVSVYYLAVMVGGLVFVLGPINRHLPIVASYFLFLTPGYFGQVVSLSIDTFRMSLQFIAMITVWYFFKRKELRWENSILAGFVIGCFIYTHSLSGLFAFPFVFATAFFLLVDRYRFNRSSWISLGSHLGVIFFISLLVGGEQYIANILAYGVPFNDLLPIAQHVPELDFKLWREARREIYDLPSKIIHGLGAGLTFPSRFGYSLHLSIFLVAFALITRFKLFRSSIVVFLVVPIGVFYTIAVVLLIIGNIELISNFRYMMTTLVFQCALAAILIFHTTGLVRKKFIAFWSEDKKPRLRWCTLWLSRAVIVMLVYFLFFPLLVDSLKIPASRLVIHSNELSFVDSKAQAHPEARDPRLRFFGIIGEKLPQDSYTLTFRQNDFGYFTSRRFLRHYDPRMIPFYKAETAQQAYSVLLDLGITHIHLPGYSLPTVSGSKLGEILSDPHITTLLTQVDDTRLFVLHPEPKSDVAVVRLPIDEDSLFANECLHEIPFWGCIGEANPFRRWGAPLKFISAKQPEIEGRWVTAFDPLLNPEGVTPYAKTVSSQRFVYVSRHSAAENSILQPGRYVYRIKGKGQGIVSLWMQGWDEKSYLDVGYSKRTIQPVARFFLKSDTTDVEGGSFLVEEGRPIRNLLLSTASGNAKLTIDSLVIERIISEPDKLTPANSSPVTIPRDCIFARSTFTTTEGSRSGRTISPLIDLEMQSIVSTGTTLFMVIPNKLLNCEDLKSELDFYINADTIRDRFEPSPLESAVRYFPTVFGYDDLFYDFTGGDAVSVKLAVGLPGIWKAALVTDTVFGRIESIPCMDGVLQHTPGIKNSRNIICTVRLPPNVTVKAIMINYDFPIEKPEGVLDRLIAGYMLSRDNSYIEDLEQYKANITRALNSVSIIRGNQAYYWEAEESN